MEAVVAVNCKTMPHDRDLSRRQFLARSAGMAGASFGLGMPRTDGAASSEAARREVSIGLVGAGDRGTGLLGAAMRVPGARIAAIADPDPGRLRQAADICRDLRPRISSDAASVLAGEDVEAVIIASPVYLHREQALLALGAGKHVYLEKPMGLTPADCRAVLDRAIEASGRGRVFQIGLQRRYNPRYRASVAAIHRGDAGKILFIRAQWHSTGSPARGTKPWYFRKEKSGDIVLEQACHQMDVFNWVLGGRPVRACGMGGTNLFSEDSRRGGIRDHYGLALEYPDGSMVHYSHLSYAIPDRRFSGVYELVFGQKMGIDLANAVAWDRGGKTIELCPAGGNDTQAAMEGFLLSVRLGEPPLAGARAGYDSTMTSILALRALDTGRMVEWSEVAG
jgi:myo-inositol 2-dehydrogenase/D-chiro-inositol 1-dehydrogenase